MSVCILRRVTFSSESSDPSSTSLAPPISSLISSTSASIDALVVFNEIYSEDENLPDIAPLVVVADSNLAEVNSPEIFPFEVDRTRLSETSMDPEIAAFFVCRWTLFANIPYDTERSYQ